MLVDHATQEVVEVCSTRRDIHVRGISEVLLDVREVRSCACEDSSIDAAAKIIQNPKQAESVIDLAFVQRINDQVALSKCRRDPV